MYRILKIGMDVHTTNYTLCAVEPILGAEENVLAQIQIEPDYRLVIQFIKRLKERLEISDKECDILCGYEAGCLGYSLYHQLTDAGIKCVILVPTTMMSEKGKRIKTDKRDAHLIAKCLCYGGYHAVYVPTADDNAVKECIRMRDDHRIALKQKKQQMNTLCIRYGCIYEGTNWTQAHLQWMRKLEIPELVRETLNEYLATYNELIAKIERFDKRIQELADQPQYQEKVKKLGCFIEGKASGRLEGAQTSKYGRNNGQKLQDIELSAA